MKEQVLKNNAKKSQIVENIKILLKKQFKTIIYSSTCNRLVFSLQIFHIFTFGKLKQEEKESLFIIGF